MVKCSILFRLLDEDFRGCPCFVLLVDLSVIASYSIKASKGESASRTKFRIFITADVTSSKYQGILLVGSKLLNEIGLHKAVNTKERDHWGP